MSNNKLKIPKTLLDSSEKLSEAGRTEVLKMQRAKIEGQSKVQVSKQQTAKEVITLFTTFFELLKSDNEREATQSEWKGRVEVAEAAVRQAGMELDIVLEKNKPRREELRQLDQILNRLLALFDDALCELKAVDVSDDVKKECRTYLADLSRELVKLKR